MKLSNVCDEDLRKIAMLKNRKGCATSDARRAQQILYTRNITHGGYNGGYENAETSVPRFREAFKSNLDNNITREYRSFAEENGYPIPEVGK